MLILLLFSSLGSFGMRFYVFIFLKQPGTSFVLSFCHLHFKLVLVFSEKNCARVVWERVSSRRSAGMRAPVEDWVYGIGPRGVHVGYK